MDYLSRASLKVEDFLHTNPQGVVVVLGATASGKTGLAISLAQAVGGEILSADSRQFYQGMLIGTAQPTAEEQKKVVHHLVGFLSPTKQYTVAEFKERAEILIEQIHSAGKVPFVVGGTGLYVDALCQNFAIPRVAPQNELRQKLEQERQEKGNEYMYQFLQKIDPVAASQLNSGASRHILRALEIVLASGQTKTTLAQKNNPRWPILYLGIDWPRNILYERINQRVAQMLADGLVAEVQTLLSAGFRENTPALTGIGYAEIISYLKGEITLDAAKAQIQQRTRNYAKRQLTWFRRNKEIIWLKPDL